jgi:autophagy-related protein 2
MLIPGTTESSPQGQRSLAANLRGAANTIVGVPVEIVETVDTHGVLKSVVKVVPLAVLKPAGALAGAISEILLALAKSAS